MAKPTANGTTSTSTPAEQRANGDASVVGGALADKSEKSKELWEDMSWKERYRYFVGNITVEPMICCYIMPCVLSALATQNLALEKACRVNLRYPTEVCDALRLRQTANYTKEEETVQQLVASMSVWKTLVQSAFPSILILFVGAWSDRWGRRKPCMILPICGELCTSIGLIFCTYFFYETPMEVVGIVESLFPALTGGWFTMFMGIFSYIGDITTVEMRTMRIGFVNMWTTLGIPIGLALSGVLFKTIGFYGIFSLSALMFVMSIAYGCCRVKDVRKTSVTHKHEDKTCGFLIDFFDLEHVNQTFRIAFSGTTARKWKIGLIMLVVICVTGPTHGEFSVMYLFTRYKFNWDEVNYSIFSTYCIFTGLLGTGFSIGFLSHVLKVDDAVIGFLSTSTKVLGSFVYAFATTTWHFYLGGIIEIFHSTSMIAVRSIISKIASDEELGKLNSIIGICEGVVPLIYGPMYSAVYAATMSKFPGAFLLLGGGLILPSAIIFAWLYFRNKKEARAAAAAVVVVVDREKNVDCVAAANSVSLANVNDAVKTTTVLNNTANGTVKEETEAKAVVENGTKEQQQQQRGIDNVAYEDA